MLKAMHPSADHAHNQASQSFAGLLASLTDPDDKPFASAADDGLEDDIATLSYERALRAHARYRPQEPAIPPLQDAPRSSNSAATRAAGPFTAQSAPAAPPPSKQTDSSPVRASSAPWHPEPALKCASITIRLSQAECEQLRHRAAEAGLTVSAYLRSCTFEAESLRTMVKEAMGQLRSLQAAQASPSSARPRQSLLARLAGFFGFRARLQALPSH